MKLNIGFSWDQIFFTGEPISYDPLWRVQDLPDELRQFTLSLIAYGETIKEIPFDYGNSFDFSVYPEIPEKDGYYAQWSTNLNNIPAMRRVSTPPSRMPNFLTGA